MNQTNNYESNELLDKLPNHLKQFIKPQNYSHYTPINQAVWRYVMRKNVKYLSKVAHESYIDGLRQTGIEVDRIANIYGMNRILKDIGWAAVAVDGFIPPNAFMEFQAHKVLVIAEDIRQLEHIEYTPAPDIIHEAAGHGPIIANPDYSEYLRRMGEIGAKAILSKYDIDLYEAVRKLSILKEAEGVNEQEIKAAEAALEHLQQMDVELSEMAQIRNLQWWTVEYGLIGDLDNYKIYGAGLLSSIGESKWCMTDNVKKLPYTIQAAYQNFDITQPQPQLYVTPDFPHLMEVLEEFAHTLSLRKGGSKGLKKLIESQMVGTIELNTGLQISGKFTRAILNENNEVIYFKTTGPTALAYREKELLGFGIDAHKNGYGAPLGKLKNVNLPLENMGPNDLKAYNFNDGKWFSFEFESGVKVDGMNITGIRNIKGTLIIIELRDCTVTYQGEVLHRPEDGIYNMAVGTKIVSAFAGAADHHSFPNLYEASKVKTIKSVKSNTVQKVEQLYEEVRGLREKQISNDHRLTQIIDLIKSSFPGHWLLLLEIYEIANSESVKREVLQILDQIKTKNAGLKHLIEEGLEMAEALELN